MLPKKLWSPSEAFINDSNLTSYLNWLKDNKQLEFNNYQDLWLWSINSVSDFWESIYQYFDIIDHSNYDEVCSSDPMPFTKWFQGTTLNYAEHIFRHKSDDQNAIIFQNENSFNRIEWDELEKRVKQIQGYLIEKGIKKGDRIAAYLPNIPEAIYFFLAANAMGAVWSCCSPDFGVETVIERFSQIDAKLLIAVDGYQYNGKPYSKIDDVKQLKENLITVKDLILVPYLNENSEIKGADNFKDLKRNEPEQDEVIFTPVAFDHPIWILYSSGTTGKPKAITHSHGGVLLEHLKYISFHNDVKKGENFFWFSTTGWMMWNYLQASMLAGATPVLFDGSPGLNNLEVLWELAEKCPIHHFGTSAPYLSACMKREVSIGSKYNLSPLRSIGSTGAPLPPEVFEWIYTEIKSDVWLCSMSGGTDVCTAFVGGNPLLSVYKGLIQSRALGCALFAYDNNGEHVSDSLGEMVIEKPMPSMPIYFWNDKNNSRYLSSYFSEYEGKWRHGDWIKIYENGSLLIQGRSDATLNRKGVRIGTAEIYNVLDKISELKDSLVLNIEKSDGEDIMPLFIVLNENENLDEDLKKKINSELRSQCSPRHVPDEIMVVEDIPYTLSGKKMEVPIKKLFMGMDVSKSMNKDAVKNPKSIDSFIKIKDIFN
ncbi:MAG: acetoacetate--CoA ligase [Saprospiraceae bacterium]|nr:acetoacetate--CoA ligase [Saprospiraceae bacterium]